MYAFSIEVQKVKKRTHTDGDLDGLALDDVLAVLTLQQIQGLAVLDFNRLNSVLDILLLVLEQTKKAKGRGEGC